MIKKSKTKNMIKGVKPFNDFFFRNCYFHQLLAGVSALNINPVKLIQNYFLKIRDNFITENTFLIKENILQKSEGYKIIRRNITMSRLKKCVDKGYPIILGVDGYYFESCPDGYLKKHSRHFILAYGYDMDKFSVNIIDHEYNNSSTYIEKVVSLKNVFLSYKMCKKLGKLEKKQSGIVIRPRKRKKKYKTDESELNLKLKENFFYSQKNIEKYENLFIKETDEFLKNIEKIADYLKNVKLYLLILSGTDKIKNYKDRSLQMSELINAYSNLLSFTWKFKLYKCINCSEVQKQSILRKIELVKKNENIVYSYFIGNQNG